MKKSNFKNSMSVLLLLFFFIPGFSINPAFDASGRLTPSVKKEKLGKAAFIAEIMPGFNRYFAMPYEERIELDFRKKIDYPQEYFYPDENYANIMQYVSVEITAVCSGKTLAARSTSDKLTVAQKNILAAADLGTTVRVKIKFRYKKPATAAADSSGKIIAGEYGVTVVPETEAEYPGGFKQIIPYLKQTSMCTAFEDYAAKKLQQAVVAFTVDENGRVIHARLSRTSSDAAIDKLLLEALRKMPVWKPAENGKGIKVKQQFNIPLGGGYYGGC